MPEKLKALYNTLSTVETKGQSTITMAECLRYLENMYKEEVAKAQAPVASPTSVEEE